MRISSLLTNLNIRNYRVYLALLLGVIFGLSVYAYWLIDVFPPTSRRIILLTILASAVGAVGYYFLLEFWIVPRFSQLGRSEKWKTAVWGTGLGLFLMFAGTSAWTSPDRYITFLLPKQSLDIVAEPPENGESPEMSIIWISTSLGDVSYDKLQLDGWERDGDQIVLKNFLRNSIRWQGRTGSQAFILFQNSSNGGIVTVSWNGDAETLDLRSSGASEVRYGRNLKVPVYASSAWVLLIVSVNFMTIGPSLLLLFLQSKTAVDEAIENSIAFPAEPGRQSGLHNKIPVDAVIVACIMLLAFLLRVFNLDTLYPYADEYTHLIAAKIIMQGEPLSQVYERGLFVVTMPVVASYSVFGESLWAARLPGVVFNVLGIIPLYLIARKINRSVALISIVLYAFSPYLIAYSRNIREYAVYPFLFYWAIHFMILFLQRTPQNLVLFKDWKKIKPSLVGLALLLAMFVPFVLYIDRLSTLRIILIAYMVFAILVLAKFDLHNPWNWFAVLTAAVVVFTRAVGVIGGFLDLPSPEFRALTFFFLNPPQQWYYDRLVLLPALAFLAGLYFAMRLRRRNFIPVFTCTLFVVYMIFFVFFFRATKFNIHPRFVLTAQLWFLPILAMGTYMLWQFLRKIFLNRIAKARLSAIVLILLSFNPNQTLLPFFFRAEYMPITELIHDNLDMVDAYIMEHARADDVLVGSLYASFVSWQGRPVFTDIYPYSNTVLDANNSDGFSYVSSIIARHPNGWVVIDELRLGFIPPSLPEKQAIIQGKNVEYVGQFLSQYVWRWSVK